MNGLTDIRDIFRGAVASLFGFSGRLIARVILMIVAGRIFGMGSLGELGQVAAISEITAAICVMGLKRSLLDQMSAEEEAKRIPERRIVEALALTVTVAALAALALTLVWWFLFPERHDLLPILFFAAPSIVIADVTLTATKFKRIIRWDVWSRCIAEPWGFLLLTLLFWGLDMKESGLLIAYVGSTIIAASVGLAGLLNVYKWSGLIGSKPRISSWPYIFKKSIPLGITDISIMSLRRMDLIILSLITGAEGAGIYFMIQQLVTVPHKVYSLFEPMLSPVIARLHNRQDGTRIRDNLLGVCRWVFIIQLAITIPMAVFGDNLLGLFGPEFIIGATALTIILIAELIDGSFLSVETPILFAKPLAPPILLIVTLLLQAGLIAGLSMIWGVEGAAFGYLLTIIFLTTGRLILLKKYLNIGILGTSYLPPITFGLCMAVILWMSRNWGPQHGALTMFYVVLALSVFGILIKNYAMTKSDRVLFRAMTQKTARRTT